MLNGEYSDSLYPSWSDYLNPCYWLCLSCHRRKLRELQERLNSLDPIDRDGSATRV